LFFFDQAAAKHVMSTRTFALVFGILFLVVGIAGFVPALLTPPSPDDPMAIEAMEGHLFGLFPVNALHSGTHMLFGVWGLVAHRWAKASRVYARSVAVIYGLLTIFGLVPDLNTLFGLMPIHGNDVWLHLLLAAVAAYFGFVAHRRAPAEEPRRRRATAR
jgi:hypothetical protein